MLVALGGAVGAVTRYGVTLAVGDRGFPLATLLVNVSGSLALGIVMAWSARGPWSPDLTRAVAVGFLGAFTTFSTFSWEAFSLGRADRLSAAAVYTGLSVVLGIAAAGSGYRLGQTFFER